MTKRQRQLLRFSKVVIVAVIIIVFIFTGVILYIYNNKASEPTTIITAFFAFMTGEVLALAKLKLAEIDNEKYENKNKKNKENIEKEGKNGNSI